MSVPETRQVEQPPALEVGATALPRPATAGPRRWIGRGFVAVIVALAALTLWPMLKGVYYGMVPPAPADQLPAWRGGYGEALAESARTGRPVLIDFTASWCPPCRVMEADVWPDADVRAAVAERVVPLQLDVDAPASAAAARRYGIQSVPTVLLVDRTGTELARGGFMSAGSMVRFIKRNAPATAPATAMPSPASPTSAHSR